MALQLGESFQIDLSVFGSLITDITPQDLPLGASPDNSDVCFFVGSVQVRPATVRVLNPPLAAADVNSVDSFPPFGGQVATTTFLDSNGGMYSNNPVTGVSTLMGKVLPGSTFHSCNSFGKQFYAFRNLNATSNFSPSPFVGADIPRYWNGQQLLKVTPGPPAASPSFQNVQAAPFTLQPIGTTTSLTVTSAQAIGLEYTTITIPTGVGNSFTYETETIAYYTAVVYTCSSSAAAATVGTTVTVTGLSNLALNITGIVTAQTGNTFTISVSLQQSIMPTNPLTGQAGIAAVITSLLVRNNNIVTACCGSSVPPFVQPGYWLSVTNSDGTQINGPDWNAVSFSLASTGIVTVALSLQLTNLLPGTVLYVNPNPITCYVTGGVLTSGILTCTGANTFQVGENITLSGFGGAGAALNGLTVAISSSSGNGFTCYIPLGNIGSTGGGLAQDTLLFSAGYIQVVSVTTTYSGADLVPSTVFTYQSLVTPPYPSQNITTQGGVVYQIWTGQGGTYANAWQVTAVYESGGQWFVDWFQLGPNTAIPTTYTTETYPVQTTQGNVYNGQSQVLTMTFGNPVTVGNTIVIGLTEFDYRCGGLSFTITDSLANTYTIDTYGTNSSEMYAMIITAPVATAGSCTITITFPCNEFNAAIIGVAAEMHGILAPIDGHGSTNIIGGTGQIGLPTPVYTSNANDVIFTNVAGRGVAPAGYSIIGIEQTPNSSYYGGGGLSDSFAYQIVTAAGAFDPIWSNGGFDVLNVVAFQLAPVTSSFIGQPTSQLQGGLRYITTIFETEDGALTSPAPPAQVTTYGGIWFLSATNILLGNNTISSRIISSTPAAGTDFFYLAPSFAPSAAGQPPLLSNGTIISDNVTTNAIIEFSDVALVQGIGVDVNTDLGNDLFSQIELPPCLGTGTFSGRQVWWGPMNLTYGLLNLSMDGGYSPYTAMCGATESTPAITGSGFLTSWAGATILIAGIPYVILSVNSSSSITLTQPFGGVSGTYLYQILSVNPSLPPGWNVANPGSATLINSNDETGFAFQMVASDNTTISQNAAETWDGNQIWDTSTPYIWRFLVSKTGGSGIASLTVALSSVSTGYVSTGTVSLSSAVLTSTPQYQQIELSAPLPAKIPPDLLLSINFSGAVSLAIAIDEMSFVNANQPVLNNTAIWSYAGNEFGYSGATGIMGFETTDSLVGGFSQRAYWYQITDTGLYQTRDNNTTEPDGWTITPFASNCGCSSPNAVDFAEEVAWWAGRYGARIFNGSPAVVKLSQEINSIWENINWNTQTLMWIKNDPVQKCTYWGIPYGAGTEKVNKVMYLSFRLVNELYDIPDPIHVSQYSGKILATDLARKWSQWTLPISGAAMCQRDLGQGLAYNMVFAGQGFGNLYTLNFAQGLNTGLDDDYGLIPAYYTTYFWFPHDMEMQPILAQFNKVFNYFSIHIVGIGNLKVTPYADALTNPLFPFPTFPLQLLDPGYDYQFPINVKGNRVAFKIQSVPAASGQGASFQLTQLIVQGAIDKFFPVRGSLFGV